MKMFFLDMVNARELLLNLTLREVRGKYKRTVFGQLWSFANPLALMLVYTFVFSIVFKIQPAPGDPSGLSAFPLWLLCGLLPWLFFATSVTTGTASLVANAGLIQKVYFFRAVLPVSSILAAGYNWLFEMGILIIVLLLFGAKLWIWLPLIILTMVLLAIFAAGIAMMLSIANAYFRDVEHFLVLILQIWFFLNPIMYPMSLVQTQSDKVGPLLGTNITIYDLYQWNPMERFIVVFRELLYDNRMPSADSLIFILLASLISFAAGLLIFRKNEPKLAEVL
ncbi:ABC transporter permease [Aurantimicrobium minutum]|uniref:Transport permease protein n=1 Tax=Aurantimicrobium minutum TaxID=708131 RepID=A0A173LUW4_9MICO|nr:ABC transporter permease [Aurantimicrobium minutum]BAU98715.1 AI-2 transporter TqsA [Aurantimicrobium minutum]